MTSRGARYINYDNYEITCMCDEKYILLTLYSYLIEVVIESLSFMSS